MRRLKILKLNQRGDTIVEVLISLAVLSLALGISFASANTSLKQSTNSQEHTEALGIISAQVEKLRSAITSGVTGLPTSSGFFCMVTPSVATDNLPYVTFSDESVASYADYPASCAQGLNNRYYVSISPEGANYGYTDTPGTSPEVDYTFVVRWPGLGTFGTQQESLSYRIGTTPGSNYATPITVSPPIVYASQTIEGDGGACYNPDGSPFYCEVYNETINGTSYNVIAGEQAQYMCTWLPYNSDEDPFVTSSPSGNICTEGSGPYNSEDAYSFPRVTPTTDSNGYTLTINYSNFPNATLPPPIVFYTYTITISDSDGVLDTVELSPPYVNATPGTLSLFQYESSSANLTGLTNLSKQPIYITWSNDYCCLIGDANFQINYVTLTPNQ
jgi:Tfp pilus assembly protein PilV